MSNEELLRAIHRTVQQNGRRLDTMSDRLARQEERERNLRRDVDELREDHKQLRDKNVEQDQAIESVGGWKRLLLMLLGASATGGTLNEVFHQLFSRGGH